MISGVEITDLTKKHAEELLFLSSQKIQKIEKLSKLGSFFMLSLSYKCSRGGKIKDVAISI